MSPNQKNSSEAGAFMVLLVIINAIILKENLVSSGQLYKLLWLTIPLLLVTVFRFRREMTKR